MSAEMVVAKPLWQQVAEALGWTYHHELVKHYEHSVSHFMGGCWESPSGCVVTPNPRFDTSWGDTGPLIERYKLYVYWDAEMRKWIAQPSGALENDADAPHHGGGDTALLAVCHLIVALHEAGKLK